MLEARVSTTTAPNETPLDRWLRKKAEEQTEQERLAVSNNKITINPISRFKNWISQVTTTAAAKTPNLPSVDLSKLNPVNVLKEIKITKTGLLETGAGVVAGGVTKYAAQEGLTILGFANLPLALASGATAGGIMAFGKEYLHNREQVLKARPSLENQTNYDTHLNLTTSLNHQWQIIKKTRIREIAKGAGIGLVGAAIGILGTELIAQIPKVLPNIDSLNLPSFFSDSNHVSAANSTTIESSLPSSNIDLAPVHTTIEPPMPDVNIQVPLNPIPLPELTPNSSITPANSFNIPTEITIKPDSNLWQSLESMAQQISGRALTPEEQLRVILPAAQQVAIASEVYVPGWEGTQGELHTALSAGRKLVINQTAKDLLQQLASR